MLNFLDGMSVLQQGFWWVAIITSIIFLVQTLLTFIGSDSSNGINADFDGNLDHVDAPFQLFSLRNLINFLLGFGWAGVAFFDVIENKMFLLVLATVVGVIFVLLFFLLIKQILKLTEDNTFKIENLKGKTGEVYINIPKEKSGRGKILISTNGTNHELDAMTASETMIPSSTMVKVVDVEGKILIVSRI